MKEKLNKKNQKEPHELGIMIKREAGYAPEAGDWQYVFVDRKGTVSADQSKLNCANCHQIKSEDDYVYRRLAVEEPADNENKQKSSNRKR